MLRARLRWGGVIVKEHRPIVILLAVTTAAGFWSTAAMELFALFFLAAVLFQGSSRNVQQHMRTLLPETVTQLIFWFLYSATMLVSFFLASPGAASLPFHMLWHPLLFPAVLLLGVRQNEVRILAAVFLFSGCMSALATLSTYPASSAEHLESLFVGDTTYFNLLVLAALAGVSLALSESTPPWVFLAAVLPAAVAVILSALRAPIMIMLGASLLLVLAARPRAAFAWLAITVVLMVFSPQALWMKMEWFIHGHPLDRYAVWAAGIRLIPTAPMFGYGPGTYADLLPAGTQTAFIHRPPTSWHNDLLQTILENGWVTALTYAAFLLTVIVPAVKASLRFCSSSAAALTAARTVLLGASLCCSLLGLVVSTSVLGAVFWILLALTATAASEDHHHAR